MQVHEQEIPQAAPATLPVRVATVLTPGQQPSWVRQVLQRINRSDASQLVLVIYVASPILAPSIRHRLRMLPLWLWQAWDNWYFGSDTGYLADVDIAAEIEGTATVCVGHEVSSENLRQLQTSNLDVVLQLGEAAALPPPSIAARYGVWRCGADSEDRATLIRLMSQGKASFVTQLETCRSSGNQVLDEAVSRLRPESLYRNLNAIASIKIDLITRQLELLHSSHSVSLAPNRLIQMPSRTLRTLPGVSAVRFMSRWIRSAVQPRIQERRLVEQWFIAFRRKHGDGIPSDMSGFQVITPPPQRFYADPFVVTRHDKSYIFFEDFSYVSQKGMISCIEVDRCGRVGPPVPVINDAYHHMSYPQLFVWERETYLVPETSDAARVVAYRALDFPYHWMQHKVVMQGVRAVDPTFFVYGGKVWLFASGICERLGAANEALFLFYSDSLFGTWHPHPKNPVVQDVRRARPAGGLFFHNGELIRPGQDCSVTYGHATCLSRVDLLSQLEYSETPIATITPDWLPGNRGTHTFNQSECMEVVDGRFLIPRRTRKGRTTPRACRAAARVA